uniref:Uncharacterized protein n=1 Tax=Steinernema glaseri TaxID=37863 RepID=A0A1I7XZC1_9BILA
MPHNKSACNKLAKGIVSSLVKRAIQRVDGDKPEAHVFHGRLLRERSLPPIEPEKNPRPEVVQRSSTHGSLPHLLAISLPSSAQFTREIGLKKISELIQKTWSYGSLRFSVHFLCVVPLQRFSRYKYVVYWTAPYGTSANVFFNIDIARVDLWRPVQISYTFDSGKVVRTPAQSSSYHNEWLRSLEAHDIASQRCLNVTEKVTSFGG